jgi:acyl-coenzyme A thioesterase PaaI-like protein
MTQHLTSGGFAAARSSEVRGDVRVGVVPDTWAPAGRAHGGMLLATALVALAAEVEHPDPLSVTAHYLRPAGAGPIELRTELVRTGRAHATAAGSVWQDGAERMRLLALFGTLPIDADRTLPPPGPLPRPGACVPVRDTGAMGMLPTDYPADLDVRLDPATPWLAGQRGGAAAVEGWVGFVDGHAVDAFDLALFADAFPPALLSAQAASAFPTLELTVHVRARPRGRNVRGRFTTDVVAGDYVDESGWLWDESGRLVAMSRQLALVVGRGVDAAASPAVGR